MDLKGVGARLNALTAQQPWLLGGLGGLVALLVLIRVLYLPVTARISERQAVLHELRVKVADAKAMVDQRPRQEAAQREAQARFRALEARTGERQSVAGVLELIAASAKQHRLQLVAVKPRTDVHDRRVVPLGEEVSLQEVPLSLQVVGRYRQIGEFLGALEGSPFIASVRKVTMVRQQAGSAQLQADLELGIYLMEREG